MPPRSCSLGLYSSGDLPNHNEVNVMANKADTYRRNSKVNAVVKRLEEIHETREVLISMLDEHKLDQIILALGIGSVELRAEYA